MKYKNFEEFKSWFQDEIVGINDDNWELLKMMF